MQLSTDQGSEPMIFPGGADGPGQFTFPYYGLCKDKIYYLDLIAPGYEPCRVRLDLSQAVTNPNPDNSPYGSYLVYDLSGDKAIKMKPLPKPQIHQDSLEMDRFGAFLPGVKKAGNQSTFNLLSNEEAEQRLTMNWSLEAKAATSHIITRPRYGSGGTEQVTLDDKITDVWLIDRKTFPDQTFLQKAGDLVLPSTAQNEYEPAAVRQWLEKIAAGQEEGFTNVFFQRIGSEGIKQTGANGETTLSGQVQLWTLPPDDFRPTFVVVTKLGAVEIFNFDYEKNKIANLPQPFNTDPTLVGMRVPEWFGSFTDVMAYAAQEDVVLGGKGKEMLKNIVPLGRLIPLPKFTADIELRA